MHVTLMLAKAVNTCCSLSGNMIPLFLSSSLARPLTAKEIKKLVKTIANLGLIRTMLTGRKRSAILRRTHKRLECENTKMLGVQVLKKARQCSNVELSFGNPRALKENGDSNKVVLFFFFLLSVYNARM